MRPDFLINNKVGKNVIIFNVDNNSSAYISSKKKCILVIGEGPTQELDDTTITAEGKYSINFTSSRKELCLSLHYNGRNSFLFVNGVKHC